VRGGILLAKGDIAGARQSFERALEIDPTYVPAAARLASMDLAAKRPEDARQRLDAVIKRDPRNLSALLAVSQLRSRTGAPPEEVAAPLKDALAHHPSNPAPRRALIDHYLAMRDLKNAIVVAQHAVAAMPHRSEILDAAGRAHQAAGETKHAILIYNKLVSLEPRSPQPLLRLAEAYVAANQNDDAIKSLHKALELRPAFLEAQQRLVGAYVASGKVEAALAVAHRVQEQRQKEPAGYVLEGDIHATLKNWSRAASVYQSGLKKFGTTEIATRLYTALSHATDRGASAAAFAHAWLKGHPQDHAFRLHMAETAFAREQYASAVQLFRRVLETSPRNASVLHKLAWAESQLNEPSALAHAEEANRLSPDTPDVMSTLAVLLIHKGEAARGLDLLRGAAARAPHASAIRLNFARALIKAGQKDAARKELDELAKLGDSFGSQQEVAVLRQRL
jgi:putative PEP-CTERM system TPR-repeat lipoprotein